MGVGKTEEEGSGWHLTTSLVLATILDEMTNVSPPVLRIP